ncbi:RNA polymerase factor sigma-70 [Gimesia fumaroli]|uniref:RNA polymerase factor sigma-70 n=2 Tax=Gimesia fumaroli TaxID=2527976 RepID=A0A518I4Y8_9PLAN|nr:RNA polymerase factor sigma-70 [Gimesia fumaroli]
MSDGKPRDLQSQKYVTINTPPSLIEALSSRDLTEFEKGFERFCELYHQRIRTWCGGWTSNEHEADDAAQELLVSLHGKLKKYRMVEGKRFRNWLSKVSKHSVRDFQRKQSRNNRSHFSFNEDMDSMAEDFVSELLIDYERRDLLNTAISQAGEKINPKDKKVLEGYLQDISTRSIAGELDTSMNAINQSMHRVRQACKGVIEELLTKKGLEENDLFFNS